MTSSAGVRRGERFDREQIVVHTEHRRVVVDLPADSGSPDVTGTDRPLPALGPTVLTVPGPASRGARDLPDADLPRTGGSDGAPEPVDAVPLELRPDGPLAPSTVAGRVLRRTPVDARREDGRVARQEGATARQALGRIGSRRHGNGHDVSAPRP
ncbi:hypothetical protein SAMN05660642_01158 [Geodermatophilus siccatus]|uniref:Uncharacterized protein n=1 Tax=Geodermatophilus siccatus TaxID=1137991 RepID=A0A1G9NRQ2_9ACTN|nr:hypothetical protein [Geodermatophilus siccatus]SDL89262.1 hypothetical protein SAMN05660642_01158 [Geodermatophilus siccatus]